MVIPVRFIYCSVIDLLLKHTKAVWNYMMMHVKEPGYRLKSYLSHVERTCTNSFKTIDMQHFHLFFTYTFTSGWHLDSIYQPFSFGYDILISEPGLYKMSADHICDFWLRACLWVKIWHPKNFFGAVQTYLMDRCGEIIDCGEKKIEIGWKMVPGGQYLWFDIHIHHVSIRNCVFCYKYSENDRKKPIFLPKHMFQRTAVRLMWLYLTYLLPFYVLRLSRPFRFFRRQFLCVKRRRRPFFLPYSCFPWKLHAIWYKYYKNWTRIEQLIVRSVFLKIPPTSWIHTFHIDLLNSKP